jgi:hypothetical protein
MTRASLADYRRKKVGSLRDRLIWEALALCSPGSRLCPAAVVQLARVPPEVKLVDVAGLFRGVPIQHLFPPSANRRLRIALCCGMMAAWLPIT